LLLCLSYTKLGEQVGVCVVIMLCTIARTVLEDICDKPIRIQSYCAVARLHECERKRRKICCARYSELYGVRFWKKFEAELGEAC
jgi:hypothetical protein